MAGADRSRGQGELGHQPIGDGHATHEGPSAARAGPARDTVIDDGGPIHRPRLVLELVGGVDRRVRPGALGAAQRPNPRRIADPQAA